MDKIGSMIMAIFGGIITLAIVSVLVSKKSSFPAAIQASSSALSNVVAAAVNPVNTSATNGNNGLATFANPALNAITSVFGGTQ